MTTYTKEQLKAILARHLLWHEGKGGSSSRADLRGADLRGADLGEGVRWARIGPQGSRSDEIVYLYGPGRDEAHAGCFTGTLDELRTEVAKKHHGTQHETDYERAIAYLRSLKEAQQ